MEHERKNDFGVLCLAPLVSTLPLVALGSVPASPWFLGRLMDDPTHPMNNPHSGPVISAMAVVFDGQILAGLVVLLLVAPIYIELRRNGKDSVRNVLALTGAAGIVASQIAHLIARGFRQPDLQAFANSWASPMIGCICGLAAGASIIYFAKRRIAPSLGYLVPIGAQFVSAAIMMASASR